MYQENLKDAFDYVGLIYIPHYPYWYDGIFPESGAVYAANGFGLCSNYTDIATCKEERENLPHQPHHENVLSVSYMSSILSSTWSIESMGLAYPGSDMFKLVGSLAWRRKMKIRTKTIIGKQSGRPLLSQP
jgi:hypothetical protein